MRRKPRVLEEEKTLHVILAIDGSWSMNEKMKNVHASLKEELAVKEEGVKIFFSLISFSSSVHTHYVRNDNPSFRDCFHGGTTCLHDAVIRATELVQNEDTVIKVFTDGKNYESKNVRATMIKAIKDTSATVTFMCTKEDEEYIKGIGIDPSNILSYVNTAEGVKTAGKENVRSTKRAAKRIVKGESIKTDFYA